MVNRYFDGVIPAPGEFSEADNNVSAIAARASRDADFAISQIAPHEAIAKIWTLVDVLNSYITAQEPWVLAKDPANRQRLSTVLYTAIEGLRCLAVLLSPVMPKATSRLWDSIGSSLGDIESQLLSSCETWGLLQPGVKLGELEALFPRVEESA
jgi:methionyl-tRNA synthetase